MVSNTPANNCSDLINFLRIFSFSTNKLCVYKLYFILFRSLLSLVKKISKKISLRHLTTLTQSRIRVKVYSLKNITMIYIEIARENYARIESPRY